MTCFLFQGIDARLLLIVLHYSVLACTFLSVFSKIFVFCLFSRYLRQTPPASLTTQRLLRFSTFVFLDLRKIFQKTSLSGVKNPARLSSGTAKVQTFPEPANFFEKILQKFSSMVAGAIGLLQGQQRGFPLRYRPEDIDTQEIPREYCSSAPKGKW